MLLSPVLMKLPTHAVRPKHPAGYSFGHFLVYFVLTTFTDVAVSLRQMSNRLTIAAEGSKKRGWFMNKAGVTTPPSHYSPWHATTADGC